MGRRLALLIATYAYQDTGLRRLTAPAHDAEAFAAVLQDPDIAGFEVTTLINEPHHRVGAAIGDLYRDRRRDDLTLLYFTGHGLKDEDGRLYLATANTRRDSLLFTSLPAEQVDQAMSGCMSRQKVLILDCCYSGAFPAGRIAKADTAVHALERFQGRGRTVLTASDATQYSFEGSRPHGEAVQSVFTRYLVAGLRDGSADLDGDGNITLDELYSYVHDRVVDEMPQQRPKKQDNVEGRIVIARNINWTLPAYLHNALSSPIANDRLAALDGLTHLHRIGNDLVRQHVTSEIQRLVDDDSRAVSAAAAAQLQVTLPQAPEIPPAPASEPAPTSATAAAAKPAVEAQAAPPSTVPEPEPTSAPTRGQGRGARIREDVRALCTDARRRVWDPVRSLTLAGLSGLLPILAAALLVAGIVQDHQGSHLFSAGPPWESLPWYVIAMAAVALIAGICTLLPRTRLVIGPGMVLGVAAASTWGLVYFPGQLRYDSPQAVLRLELAGHLVLVVAACLAGLVLRKNRTAHFEPRQPRNLLTWAVAILGGIAATVGAWALSGELHQAARLAEVHPATYNADRARSYLVATVQAIGVPVWAALVTPRRFALSLLGGWVGGAFAIALGTFAWRRDVDESYGGVIVFGCSLLVLAAAGAVMARWSATTVLARLRRTALIVGLAVVPLLAATGAVVVDRVAHPAVTQTPIARGVVVSPDGRRAYVTTSLVTSRDGSADLDNPPGRVSVIDTTTNNTIGKPIPVGNDPIGVAVSPDGSYVYVANSGADSVTVISTPENTTLGKPIPVGDTPTDVTVTSDGRRLYVVNNGSDDVSVIDTETNKTLGSRIPLGAAPDAVAVSPDGRRIYVAKGKSGAVSVIDTTTGKTMGDPLSLGYAADSMAVSPDGRRLYVTTKNDDGTEHGISVVDTATTKKVGSPVSLDDGRGPFSDIAVSPDGRRAYVTDIWAAGVWVIDTKTNTALGSPVPVGSGPMFMAVSPDSRRVYITLFSLRDKRNVAVFKANDPETVSVIDLQAG